ncbi:MAG: cytochrome C [Geobacter sp.]|nr:cytochrome C [Geobacter sp.]
MGQVITKIMAGIAILSLSSVVLAAGPDTIELPASMGKVTFNHKLHQENLKDCSKCHAKPAGGKIEGFGKDLAHNICKGCHAANNKGPTSCKECHKK